MDHLGTFRFDGGMNQSARTQNPSRTLFTPSYEEISKGIAKRSFATLATVSPQQEPHAVGVVYSYVEGVLYVSTDRASRKARNIASNANVFVSINVRRMPFGPPPSSIQFRATAELLDVDHPDVIAHAAAGRLRAIVGHGELERPGSCIVRITGNGIIHTYGLGMSLKALGKDPLNGAGRVTVPRQ
jgi:hypothetical protein